jgi:hypothetical protein
LAFLVIEREVDSKLEEMVRLRDALPPLGVPVDVFVATEGEVLEWACVTRVNAALSEGPRPCRVVTRATTRSSS